MNHQHTIYATVEVVILTYHQNQLKVFLQKNTDKSLKGKWTLPVFPLKTKDSIEKTIKKASQHFEHLELKTGWNTTVFSDPERFPKKRVIAFPVIMFCSSEKVDEGSLDSQWISISLLSGLVLDHKKIINEAISSLRMQTASQEYVFHLLPSRFTLTQLQECLECIYETTLDKRNFRKRILLSDVVKPTKSKEKGVAHKAAVLYTLNSKALRNFKA
jgi:8-oxo-dGTP diphosphatase